LDKLETPRPTPEPSHTFEIDEKKEVIQSRVLLSAHSIKFRNNIISIPKLSNEASYLLRSTIRRE